MHIRYAKVEDIETIQTIAKNTWPVAYAGILTNAQLAYMLELIYSTAALTHQLNDTAQRFILGIENDTAVGFASFSPVQNTSTFHINKLYVLPTHQGKNVGQQMLLFVEDAIRSEGAAIITLNVNRNNSAIYFYEKMGYYIDCEEDINIGNGFFMNDYVMKKSISTTTKSIDAFV